MAGVGVGGDEGSCVIGDANDVAHLVGQVEVLGPVVKEAGRVAGVVILEIHGVRPVCLRQDDAIFCCEVGGHSVDRFAGPDAGLVISIAIDVGCAVLVFRVHRDLREHSAVRPLELHVAIGQNIAIGVISQARAVDAGQFVRPGRVAIGESGRLCRSIHIIVDLGFSEGILFISNLFLSICYLPID